MKEESSKSQGLGFLGLLALVFITLKLTGTIDWSWWWVTAPLWGGLAFALILTLMAVILSAVLAHGSESSLRMLSGQEVILIRVITTITTVIASHHISWWLLLTLLVSLPIIGILKE